MSTCVRANARHELRYLQTASECIFHNLVDLCLIHDHLAISMYPRCLKHHPFRTGEFKDRARRRELVQFKDFAVVNHSLGRHFEELFAVVDPHFDFRLVLVHVS